MSDVHMVLVTPGPVLVVIGRRPRSKWYDVVCFGRKRHYRKRGDCVHTDNVLAAMRPEIRQRAKITPFGARAALAAAKVGDG